MALFISDVPVLIACSTLLISITYFMIDQPPVDSRLIPLLIITSLNSLSSAGVAILLSSYFNILVRFITL
jgi:hypothetical protein